MKNRTIIGIVCMILAVAMTFAIAPVVNRLTSGTITVVRLKQEVGRGTKITEDQVETVKVKTDTMPQGVYAALRLCYLCGGGEYCKNSQA